MSLTLRRAKTIIKAALAKGRADDMKPLAVTIRKAIKRWLSAK